MKLKSNIRFLSKSNLRSLVLSNLLFLLFFAFSLGTMAQKNDIAKLMEQFRYREALQQLQNHPENADNLRAKAVCYEKLYDFANATQAYRQVLALHPDDLNTIITLAEVTAQSGDANASLNYWKDATRISPDNLHFKIKRTQALYRAAQWKETIESANEVLREDSVPTLLRWVGDAYKNQRDVILANDYYSKALRKNPSDYLALGKLCDYYYSLEQDGYDTLEIMTDKYLKEIDSTQTLIGQFNGMALYSKGEFSRAVDRLSQNVALGDSSYTTLYFLGMSCFAQSHHYRSAEWLGKAYELNDKDIQLLYYYATSLVKTKNPKLGLMLLDKALDRIAKMEELKLDIYSTMAEGYMNVREYKNAITTYQKLYSLNPDDKQILFQIARVYEEQKDGKNAMAYYERFLKTAPKGKKYDEVSFENLKKTGMNLMDYNYRNAYMRWEELKKEQFFRGQQKE